MSGEIAPAGRAVGLGSPPELRASHADRDRAVDVLRVAAGDGRLTSTELDERVEAALSARTVSELSVLTADLPPVSSAGGAVVAEIRDVLRIDQKYSAVERVGRWVLPRRLELDTRFCEVTLDFTQAVVTQDTLRIDLAMVGKNLTLITGPGIVVDTDELNLAFSKIRARQAVDPDRPVTLRVELVGKKTFGRVVVRPPRRTVGQWLLRKPGTPAADN